MTRGSIFGMHISERHSNGKTLGELKMSELGYFRTVLLPTRPAASACGPARDCSLSNVRAAQ